MSSPTLLAMFTRSEARLAARPEASELATPLSFGDVPAEYRAGVEGAALFDASDRGLLSVSGTEAVTFLHRLLANDVRNLGPGRGSPNLLLAPKGKVLFTLDLFVEDDCLRLAVPPGQAPALRSALETYQFSEDVRIVDASASSAPLELVGPQAELIAARVVDVLPPPVDHSFVRTRFGSVDVRVERISVAGSLGLALDAGPRQSEALWMALVAGGARPAGLAARESLRVEAGHALFGVDIDENVYPQEARLERAFSLDKGCYVGQEVVAKIDTYGGLNKRLVGLAIDGDDPVARGTSLVLAEPDDGRDLGLVTSWAYSFVRDGGLALGFVKRRHQAPGTRFLLGDGSARGACIVALPVRAGALALTGAFE